MTMLDRCSLCGTDYHGHSVHYCAPLRRHVQYRPTRAEVRAALTLVAELCGGSKRPDANELPPW